MTTISVHLNLPQVNLTNILTNNNDLTVFVESTESGTCCKDCGKQITRYHSLNKIITLNHLLVFGKPVWYQSIGHFTQPYANYILDLLVNSTIQDVARQENISYKRIINIIKQHIQKK